MLFSMITFVGGLFSAAYTHSIIEAYVCIGVISTFGLTLLYMLTMELQSKNQMLNSGVLFGVTLSSGLLGNIVFSYLASYLISTYGWRMTLIILSVYLLVNYVLIFLSLFCTNIQSNESINITLETNQINSDNHSLETIIQISDGDNNESGNDTLMTIFMNRNIALFMFSQIFVSFVYYLPYAQLVLISTPILKPNEIQYVLPTLSLSNMISRLFFGYVCDHLSIKYLYIIICIVTSATLLLMMCMVNIYSIFIITILLGINMGSVVIATTFYVKKLVNIKHFTLVYGVVYGLWIPSTIVPNLLFSSYYDEGKTYNVPIIIVFVISFLSVPFTLFINPNNISDENVSDNKNESEDDVESEFSMDIRGFT